MSNRFYLTEPNITAKIKQEKQEEVNPERKNSFFLVKNKSEFSKTQTNMLKYMMTEETQFADLEKIEEFYKNSSVKLTFQINDLTKEKDNKTKQLEEIELAIQKVI